jgi:hypothetical protein
MNAALRLEQYDPHTQARAKYRAELSGILDELAEGLDYRPGSFAKAAKAGRVADTPETHDLLVAARLAA